MRSTRGFGMFEKALAALRYSKAKKLIAGSYFDGRILDIGCGPYPVFLTKTDFLEKYGIDNTAFGNSVTIPKDVSMIFYDFNTLNTFPFQDNFFDVITMLAVFEHIKPEFLEHTLREVYGILKQGGRCVMTTPAHGTEGILKFLSKLSLVSTIEIDDHKHCLPADEIIALFEKTGFQRSKIFHGYFELGMNTWLTAEK